MTDGGAFRSALRGVVRSQVCVSRWFDALLPGRFRVDGNADFIRSVVWRYLRTGQRIVDVGGGKQPLLTLEKKTELRATVTGVDISAEELSRAPAGCYDATICADVTTFEGDGSADVVICQALLEHVPDLAGAMRSITSMLSDRGVALLFIPSRNAWYARLNRVLPAELKRRLLFTIFPETARAQGFDAFYDRCTPCEASAVARACGLNVEELRLYYASSYFSCFFPAFLLWRAYSLALAWIAPERAAETFTLVVRRAGKAPEVVAHSGGTGGRRLRAAPIAMRAERGPQ